MTRERNLFRTVLLTTMTLFSMSAFNAEFPLRSDDLKLNQRYKTDQHGGGHLQTLAKDISAVRWIVVSKIFSKKLQNTLLLKEEALKILFVSLIQNNFPFCL